MKLLIITQKVDEQDQLLGFFPEWLKRFAGKFQKITVLCLQKGKFKLPENVKVVDLGKDSGASKAKQLFNFYFQLVAMSSDYDSVLVHMNPIWVVLGGPLWRLSGKKIFFWYTHKAVTPKLKLAEKFADVIFTASKESFRIPSKKVVITGHGIDTELFKPDSSKERSSNKLSLLSVGRIAPVKNYGVLIDAAKILKDKGIDFSVTMIGEPALTGDKDYELRIKNKTRELGISENFKFIGKVTNRDLPDYYRVHDIFIHLSKTGSVDKTLLEAMACGMKVVSSNDSARAFLPKEMIFKEDSSLELADKISYVAKSSSSSALRDYVVNSHNLDKLIDNISGRINSSK